MVHPIGEAGDLDDAVEARAVGGAAADALSHGLPPPGARAFANGWRTRSCTGLPARYGADTTAPLTAASGRSPRLHRGDTASLDGPTGVFPASEAQSGGA
ncbi:hypothetical protein GCM10009834_28710 [Streptomonospora arabica]